MKNLTKISVPIFIAIMMITVACQKDDPTPTTPRTTTTGFKSAAKDITKFSFVSIKPALDATIDANTKEITAIVPNGTNLTKLVPSISISDKATVSITSYAVYDFTSPMKCTVTAEDASTVVYRVSVTVSSSLPLANFVVSPLLPRMRVR